jgi:hypothetical protein
MKSCSVLNKVSAVKMIKSLPKTFVPFPNEDKIVTRKQGATSVMVWAAASEEGKFPLVFIDPGVKINAANYIASILENALFPEPRKHLKGICTPFNKKLFELAYQIELKNGTKISLWHSFQRMNGPPQALN